MKRKNSNRAVLAIAAFWQLGVCVWLVGMDLELPILFVMVSFLITAVTGLISTAVPRLPDPFPQVSALIQAAGVAGAILLGFAFTADTLLQLVPFVLLFWLGPAIVVAIIGLKEEVKPSF